MPATTYSQLSLTDFSGGLNLVAAPSELQHNETPFCYNVTLDERGGVAKRLGTSFRGDTAGTTAPKILYYSRTLDKTLMQVGTALYKSDNGGVTWSASIKTFSTTARIGLCDFAGKVVIIHPADGAFTYDGASVSAKVTNSPNGNCLAVWKNAIWSAGDPAQPTRLTRSDLGAITWPATPLTNDFRAKDDTEITALAVTGTDLSANANDAFLVFKEESAYRVTATTNDAYMMISPTYGASGPLCVALNQGEVAALCRRGITVTSGTQVPRLASSKLEPLFRDDQLAFSHSSDWCAGVFRDRFVYSLTQIGASKNTLMLEHHPGHGWIVPHTMGGADPAGGSFDCFANYASNARMLLGAKVGSSSISTGTSINAGCFQVFKGGREDAYLGGGIPANFQTPWIEPANGTLCRFRRLRIRARGSFTVGCRLDYADAGGRRDNFVPGGSGMIWGTGIWGTGIWGASLYESYNDFYSYGVGKAVSFTMTEVSGDTATGKPLLGGIGGAVGAEVGAFACYGLELDFIPLGGA